MPEPEEEARRPTSVEQQERLESLGYSADLVKRARNRSGGDTNLASELLLTNRLPDEREEFEIVAEATDPDGKSGTAKRSTDRAEKAQSGDEANHRSGAIESAPASALLETPISTLVGCGFGAAEAEAALKASSNDVEAAVTALLERKRCEAAEFGPSPHDVLAEADDPYRRDAKKRPEPVPNNPDKGHFRDGLGPNADPGEILDNRLAHLRDMGFNVRDAEAALKAAHNNVDQALSLLLNLHGSGSYFNESPHDVLADAPDPYRRDAKKRPDEVPNDVNKGHFRDDLPADASPGQLVDARLHTFTQMGFSVQEAEQALQKARNDVNLALSLLLGKSASS